VHTALMARKHPTLVRPFALLGLAMGLAGTALGAVLLARIDLSLGLVPPLWKEVHGQLQVFGFIVPLVLGFGTYLVPRIAAGHPIRGAFAWPALAGFGVAALLAIAAPFAAVGRPLALFVAIGTIAGVACLEAPLRARRTEGGRRVHELLLEVSIAFLALAGLADAAAWWLSEDQLSPGFASAAWRFGVEGFAVGMALAVSARMFSGFLGIEPAFSYAPVSRVSASRERVFIIGSWTWALSVALGGFAAAFESHRLERVAEIVFALGVVPLSFQLGLARTTGGPAVDRTRDPIFPFGARSAYALLVAGALVGAVAAAADLADLRVHSVWLDARRHLINIGFLLTLIATMAGRLAPGFAGRPLALPGLRVFALVGFGLSAVLRALEAVAGQWGPTQLLWLSAASGPLAAAALLALALSVATTFASKKSRSG
jgi:hypothetical protein